MERCEIAFFLEKRGFVCYDVLRIALRCSWDSGSFEPTPIQEEPGLWLWLVCPDSIFREEDAGSCSCVRAHSFTEWSEGHKKQPGGHHRAEPRFGNTQ